jgi:hypothetical protein
MFVKFSFCDPKKLKRGRVCKSKAETLSYLQNNYGGAYLQVLLPNSFIDTQDRSFRLNSQFDGRVTCPITSVFQGIQSRVIP